MQTGHGATVYCDWEDTRDIWNARGWRVARGLGLDEPPRDAHYRRSRRGGALKNQMEPFLEAIDHVRPVLTVIDSVGMASGAGNEHQSYEDRAIELFEALEDVPGAILLIDHISAETKAGKGLAGKAYGSMYKRFLARQQWEAVQQQKIGDKQFQIGLFHTKGNHSEQLAPLGFVIDFTDGAMVRVQRESVTPSGAFSAKMQPDERMRDVLKDGQALSTKDLSERLDATQDMVRQWLHRYASEFERLPDGRIRRADYVQEELTPDMVRDGLSLVQLEDGTAIPF
jgi:hypothetical protein